MRVGKVWNMLEPQGFFESGLFTDVIIQAKDGQVRAHRFVLAAASHLLRDVLRDTSDSEDDSRILVPDISHEEVQKGLDIVYGKNKRIDLRQDNSFLKTCGLSTKEEAVVDMKVEPIDATEVPSQVQNKNGKVICPLCGKAMTTSQSVGRHIAQSHKHFRDPGCLLCDQSFLNSDALDSHIARTHRFNNLNRKCSFCGGKYGSEETLELHELHCSQIPSSSSTTRRSLSNRRKVVPTAHIKVPIRHDKPGQCPHESCQFSHHKPSEIRQHYLSKHCRQICPYCDKVLSALHMERHIVMAHTKQFNFVCDKCSKGFFKQRDLNNHVDEEHVKEMKHVCDTCGKGFFSQGKLYSHTYRFHVSNKWRCNQCNKEYSGRKSLIKHLYAHHNGQGIDNLFKDSTGKLKQVRRYRHVQNELNFGQDTVILDKTSIAPFLIQPHSSSRT